jgi:SSS family solute:Na+ symporter
MTLVFGLFINLQNFAADQTFVQRYFAARSEQDARRSVWLGALAFLPISGVLFFIGTGLFVFYSTVGNLPEGTSADSVLPHFIMSELPTGIAGLLIAAILAAAMSTVDSSLNSSATLLLCDVRNRFFVSDTELSADATKRAAAAELRFLRVMTVVLGIAGIAVALAMMDIKSMLDVWWKISGVLSGGTLGLILLARFTNATGTFGSGLGVFAGITSICAIVLADMQNPPDWLAPLCNATRPILDYLHPLMAIVVGTLLVVVVGVIFSSKDRSVHGHQTGRDGA